MHEGRFWNHSTLECIDFVTCTDREARDDSTNTCYELYCPDPILADGCVEFSVCDGANQVLNKETNECEEPEEV